MSDATPRPRPVSRGAPCKIVATVVGIGGAIALLAHRVDQQGRRVLQARRRGDGEHRRLRGKKLQVHGHVVDGSIEQARGRCMYRFKIESRPPRAAGGHHRHVHAAWSPTRSRAGAEVVAKGTLTADNQLDVVPDGIMAKCPSKYNADERRGRSSNSKRGDVAQKAASSRLGVAEALDRAEPAGAHRRVQRRQPRDQDRRRRDADDLLGADLHRQLADEIDLRDRADNRRAAPAGRPSRP